ncbi:MAG: cohesin domain-containing protein, partial [Bacteroidota bacterium]
MEANIGDTVSVAITTTGFNQIVGFQYTTEWNPDELEFLGIQDFAFANLNESSFGISPELQAQGRLPVSWIDGTLQAQTLSDGATLYSIAFRVKNIEAERSVVKFIESPAPVEIIFDGEIVGRPAAMYYGGVHLAFANQTFKPIRIDLEGSFGSDCSDQGGAINISTTGGTAPYNYQWEGPGNFRAEVQNIDSLVAGSYFLTVSDFEGMQQFAEFEVFPVGDDEHKFVVGTNFTCIDSLGLVDIAGLSFSQSADSRDTFFYSWSTGQIDTIVGLDASTIRVQPSGVYSLTVTNTGGCQSVVENIRPAEFCESFVPAAFLRIPEVRGQTGDTLDVFVQLGTGSQLTALNFSLNWDTSAFDLVDYRGGDILSPATINPFATGLTFSWVSQTPSPFIDGDTILSFRLLPKIMAGSSLITFSNDPLLTSAQNANQNTVQVIYSRTTVIIDGDLAPIRVTIGNTIAGPEEETCVPILVSGFTDIIGMQMQLAWDTSAFIFSEVRNFGLPDL